MTSKLLFESADWTFETLERIYGAVEEIALGELGLEVHPNRVEVITPEQMLDAYAATGMPILYPHWSFGKHFVQHETMYQKGLMGLAYEIVINSSPCISYLMEGNTTTMQALVIAHAAFGHNHFFRNNYLFKQWTDPQGILDYLEYAQRFVARCEEKYGAQAVELTLDAGHALMPQGVFRSTPKEPLDLKAVERRARARAEAAENNYDVLWRTLPDSDKKEHEATGLEKRRQLLGLPAENILDFLGKHAPRLKPWQRELLNIVQQCAQYFYPQRQTKVMNEGCATYVHYRIMTRLHEKGLISDGSFLEFLQSHTNVTLQRAFDAPNYAGINPYALGFGMMMDVERIVTGIDEFGRPCKSDQLAEDREWFPDIAGSGDAMAVLRNIWANYRDESFIAQFLSPRLMSEWRMYHLRDDPNDKHLTVEAIHDQVGYRDVRRALAALYDPAEDPLVEIESVDLEGDRKLVLSHAVKDGTFLARKDATRVLQHLANLWGYAVELHEVGEKEHREDTAEPSAEYLALCA